LILAVADTHALIWYLSADPRLSPKAKAVFDSTLNTEHSIGVSSISFVEMVYLIEKGKIPPQLASELQTADSMLEEIPVDLGV